MAELDILIVIPARMQGRRFPGKPLAEVGGRPLVWYAWEVARTWDKAASIVVASPDDDILDACRAFGAVTQHSDPELRNGSQRAFEVLGRNPKYRVVIDLQCDEPGVTHAMLDRLAITMDTPCPTIATLAAPFPDGCPSADPNEVKVIVNRYGRAMHFTRQAIVGTLRHIGVYAFPAKLVYQIAKLPESQLASAERLEQLDWLDSGWDVQVVQVAAAPPSVNTRRDLELFGRALQNGGG